MAFPRWGIHQYSWCMCCFFPKKKFCLTFLTVTILKVFLRLIRATFIYVQTLMVGPLFGIFMFCSRQWHYLHQWPLCFIFLWWCPLPILQSSTGFVTLRRGKNAFFIILKVLYKFFPVSFWRPAFFVLLLVINFSLSLLHINAQTHDSMMTSFLWALNCHKSSPRE